MFKSGKNFDAKRRRTNNFTLYIGGGGSILLKEKKGHQFMTDLMSEGHRPAN